ncbi:serine hydrolase [Spongiimicrobium sp. 3-5]|uniref:serine hydrolase n=1 Tax=Spongiimicrobium sp. 3-5 TaxID=3332596 RepID=UPI00398179E6
MKKKFFLFLAVLPLLNACETAEAPSNPLLLALKSQDPNIKRVMDSLAQHELQIRYTRIDRTADSTQLTDYDFQVDKDAYFYPASTVKFPIAVLTLEKLNTLDILTMNTKFYVEGDSVETTFAKEISKIFAVSDNEAYNRLLEFLGQDYINKSLEEKAIAPVRISHRLSTTNADDVTTKPLVIYLNDSTTHLLEHSINRPPKTLHLKGVTKGLGYYSDDILVEEPFDFSLKNYYPIAAQHGVLKRTLFPKEFTASQQFKINDAQRQFLLQAMHSLPNTLGYDPERYYDSYVKFFMFGDTTEDIPEHFKIYNKVGYAYGTLTDCAYIIDSKNNVEFMLTATLLVNKDGIFNDDAYEYDDIGIPFLAALGRKIYDIELNRKK